MIPLAIAIFSASLLGSMHCVGMCGPFALWATGGDRRMSVLTSYHLGRLSTYLSAGLVAGIIGSTLSLSGEVAGFQALAAKVAGGMLVIIGIVQMIKRTAWIRKRSEANVTAANVTPANVTAAKRVGSGDPFVKPSRLAGWIQAAGPTLASQGPMGRAYLGGLLTTWLPCGWLYLFVLVAGGTGHVATSLVVMLAFWVGTLPALTGLIYGAQKLAVRFRTAIPTATSIVLILTGMYTATGRAHADLTRLNQQARGLVSDGEIDAEKLDAIADAPLPCCCQGESTCGGVRVADDSDADAIDPVTETKSTTSQ
ncbi:MAG: sulfite exporter TauE/SafE family protein [Planctomycetota bacterium]